MGHVALSLSSLAEDSSYAMRIVHDVNYCLKLIPLDKYFVKTL